jgi:hypothetical protein
MIWTAALLSSAVPALISDTAAAVATPVVIQARARDMMRLADDLWRQGRRNEAEIVLLALSRDPDSAIRREARLRHAAIREESGDLRAAAMLLREVVDENPRASATRLKLAMLLQSLGDEEAARRQLRALHYSDLPIEAGRFADHLTALLQSRKPVGIQFEFALAPDSNINLAPRSRIVPTVLGEFTIDQGNRSGVGAAARVNAHARVALGEDLALKLRTGGDAKLYRDEDFDDITADIAVAPELNHGRNRLRLEASLSQQWLGLKAFERTMRLTGTVIRPIGRTAQIRVDAGRRWSDNRMNDRQDGKGLFLRASYERALSATTAAVMSAGIDRFEARDRAFSSLGWNAGITLYRDVGRTTVDAGFSVAGLAMDERIALFFEPRKDRAWRLNVGATWRQLSLGGFAPFTRLIFETNASTLAIYDFKRTRTEFGLTRAF